MEIITSPQKDIDALQNSTILKEAIVAKVVVAIVLMGLIKKRIARRKMDKGRCLYKRRVAKTHHRIAIRYP